MTEHHNLCGVVDSPQLGYATNWAILTDRLAQSQTKSKEEYAKLNRLMLTGSEPDSRATVWNSISKRDVTKDDIENRCKKYSEQPSDYSIPRPSVAKISDKNRRNNLNLLRIEQLATENLNVRIENLGVSAKSTEVSKPQCYRCAATVYPKELLEPHTGVAFHEWCFRCEECGLKLSLKTFATNQKDPTDPGVYCKNHAPQLDAGKMDHTAQSICGYQRVPKVATYNGQIRGPDAGKAVKYDTSALGMQTALNAPRPVDRTSHQTPPPDVVKSDVIGLRYF